MLQYFLMTLMFLTALFLILLILIQRGRGGGLAGAFGGMGGQSAFGTKAGDLFTRITIGTAAVWIILCAASVKVFSLGENRLDAGLGAAAADSKSPTDNKGAGKNTAADKSDTKAGDTKDSDTKNSDTKNSADKGAAAKSADTDGAAQQSESPAGDQTTQGSANPPDAAGQEAAAPESGPKK